jgi:hypothetical protein
MPAEGLAAPPAVLNPLLLTLWPIAIAIDGFVFYGAAEAFIPHATGKLL